MPYIFEVGLQSDRGEREENQDRLTFFNSQFGRVFVLADGMGGHKGGSTASSLAVSSLAQVMQDLPPSLAPQDALVRGVQTLNTLIIDEAQRSQEELRQMGSTLVALLLLDTEEGLFALGAHVGDSRLYFARGAQMFRFTQDHTVVQQLLLSGALSRDEAARHPQASILTRALGRACSVLVELTSWTMVQPGDIFLLCSDGLSGYTDDVSIRNTLLQAEPVGELARQLIRLALQNESQDNVSVLVVRVSEEEDWNAEIPEN